MSISVVIPSHNRHLEVLRCVKSVLAQTLPPTEVIVSNDGPDPEKARLLAELGVDCIRFVEAPRRANASANRNYGIQHARGDWVALLDDDDLWRPNKLECQFEALQSAGLTEAVLAGIEQVHEAKGRGHFRPAKEVPYGVDVSEFLFCGSGGAHTSTLMAPKTVFEKHPLNEGLERHEDWTWLLQVCQRLPLIVAPEVICDRWLAPGEGLSRPGGFPFSRQWYDENHELMTPRARAAFVANILSRKAAHDHKLGALPWIVGEIARHRGFSQRNLAHLITPWLIPERARKALKALKALGIGQ